MPTVIQCAAATVAGRLHRENQDRVATDPDRGIFLVVDGIGGLADAAATAESVATELPGRVRTLTPAGPDVADSVTAVVAELNDLVRRTARSGPGTTGAAFALLVLRDGLALVVHLGDSRIYLARAGRFARLTGDHALDGQLTRFVGMPGDAVPGVSLHELTDGDRFLLCTDGLTAGVGDDLLYAVLSGRDGVDVMCERLIAAAGAGGAADDVSVAVVQYGEREVRR